MAVRVEEIRGAEHALQSHEKRVVLILLEFVSNNRHLLVEVLARDEAVRHAICLEVERPCERRVGGSEGLEVIGPVERGRRVEGCPMRADLRRRTAVPWRTLELH